MRRGLRRSPALGDVAGDARDVRFRSGVHQKQVEALRIFLLRASNSKAFLDKLESRWTVVVCYIRARLTWRQAGDGRSDASSHIGPRPAPLAGNCSPNGTARMLVSRTGAWREIGTKKSCLNCRARPFGTCGRREKTKEMRTFESEYPIVSVYNFSLDGGEAALGRKERPSPWSDSGACDWPVAERACPLDPSPGRHALASCNLEFSAALLQPRTRRRISSCSPPLSTPFSAIASLYRAICGAHRLIFLMLLLPSVIVVVVVVVVCS
jgi:hypothetical protein